MIPSKAKRGALVAVTRVAVILVAGTLSVVGAPGASATGVDGACVDGNGVTVVVDFTEFGGSVALLAAGFVATNSGQGLICAIDVKPDRCPVTFEGSFWSYWHSSRRGSWISYQVGADASHPVSGELEGWRYNDGATGPGMAPSEVTAATQPAATSPTRSADTAEATNGGPLFITLGAAAVLILVILLVARSRRRRAAAGD